jgi:tetrapyrrole methylase family protein/MazG family protein
VPPQKSLRILLLNMDSDRLCRAVVALVELVTRLRSPGGCPWDAKQTDSTLKMYLIEEAYETLDAIEKSSPKDVCMELGDLLFQILFLAHLAAERKEFDFTEVVEKITEKMIRRHPHVFGETRVDSAEDVTLNWARIKAKEKGAAQKTASVFESVPTNLPALLRTHRLSERASKLNADLANGEEIWNKVLGQFEALKSSVTREDRDSVREAMGWLLFSLSNLTRHWGFNAESLLRLTNQEFLECFEKTEKGGYKSFDDS